MFQLPIRRVMQTVLLLLSLVSISSVCQADSIKFNDWKSNATPDSVYRLKIQTRDANLKIRTYIFEHTPGSPGSPVYEYMGPVSNGYYTLYYWKCTDNYIFGDQIVVDAWAENQVNGFGEWYYAGQATYSVVPAP